MVEARRAARPGNLSRSAASLVRSRVEGNQADLSEHLPEGWQIFDKVCGNVGPFSAVSAPILQENIFLSILSEIFDVI